MRLTISGAACGLGTVVLVAAASAQPTAPPRRAHHAIAYDDARQRVVLTGGSTPLDGGQRYEFFNDLWEYDGARWSPLPPSGERLSGQRLAFDRRRNQLVSLGGFDGTTAVAAFRVLENNAWQTIAQTAPPPAAEPGLVYDSRRDRLVAFGGSAGRAQAHADTWEYDGSSWSKAVAGPPARQAHAMAFDERRGYTVIFGGVGVGPAGQPPPALGDTWEFDGASWTQRQVAGPSPRHSAGITYDNRRGLVILFGGLDADGFKGDTWSWNGTEWKQLAVTGPEPRGMGYLAYDKRRDRVVLFGGRKGWPNGDLNDTWEWDGRTWRPIP